MVNYDMHVHSTYSDGTLSVQEIIEICKKESITGIAITDHDTVAAFSDESFLKDGSIDIIPGIELSTFYNGNEIHILGYFIDHNNENLLKVLEKIRDFRFNRAENMISKLNDMGYNITIEDVLEGIDNISSIGRPHIARCLARKGYFKDTNEVFDKILGNGKPACVERYKLHPREGISLIKEAGGVPVLAHAYVGRSDISSRAFKEFIEEIISYGIMGLEVYHSLHSNIQEGNLLNYAIKHKLLITGGSDCHNMLDEKGKVILGSKGISTLELEKLKSVRK